MKDYISLHTIVESDGELKALLDYAGLELTVACLGLEVRSLRATRGLVLTTDIDSRDYEGQVRGSLSLKGEATMERVRDMGETIRRSTEEGRDIDVWVSDRLGIWDGKDGIHLTERIGVSLHTKPDPSWRPLDQTASVWFLTDPLRDFEAPRWHLDVPLPEAELRTLYEAVNDGTVRELWISVHIDDLVKRKREFEYWERKPTDYFALPTSLVTKGELPASRYDFTVNSMPCGYVEVSARGDTMVAQAVAGREIERQKEESVGGFEPEPPSIEPEHLSALRSLRDALLLIAAAVLLIFIALLV